MRPVNKILYGQFRTNFWKLFLILVLMLLIVALDAIAPWPFKILIDNVLSANPIDVHDKLNFLLKFFHSRELLGFFAVFAYFVSTFLLAIVGYVRSVVTKKVIKSLTTDFSKRAFNSLQSLAIGFYNKQQIGDYIYRLSYDTSALGDFFEEGIIPLFSSALYFIVTVGIMLFIDVRLTLFSLVALPFLAVGLYFFNIYTVHATKRSEFLNSATLSFIQEALTHLKIIQAFSQQHRESRTFDRKVDTLRESDVVSYRLDFLLTLLVAVIIAVSYSFIILYGIRAVFAGTLTTGLLVVFIFYLDNLINPLLSIIYSATAAQQAFVKIQRMNDFFSKRAHLHDAGSVRKITDTTIRFEHVTVIGDKGGKMLDDVSFEIEPQKRTIIFGENGSGKTSVVNLILRFINRPSSGRVFLGGIPIDHYNLKALRDAITFVPQEITLFDDTIHHNIVFGNPESSWADVRRAAKLAAADDFIRTLPGRYHYRVGEAGTLLSGGQRQRLMLARALMKKDAKILLFDETLSALDVKTRQQVIDNIYRFSRGKTTIIVSNIFDVVSAADQVIVLNKGRVIYAGASSRLPKELALYKMIIEND